MIGKDSFTLMWLQDLRKKVGRRTDPKLLEKVIHALALLERIQAKGFELIFKGGTLSIDDRRAGQVLHRY